MISDGHVACGIDYKIAYSIVGWDCLNFMSGVVLPSLDILRNVSYTLSLNILCVSLGRWASMWAI
jgi:hypothetical protein